MKIHCTRSTAFYASLVLPLLLALTACSSEDDAGGRGGDDDDDCPAGERLVNGECQPVGRDTGGSDASDDTTTIRDTTGDGTESEIECEGEQRQCEGANAVAICDGGFWRFENCLEDQTCVDGVCVDLSGDCTPGAHLGCHDESSYRLCAENGTSYDVYPCPDDQPNCLFDLGECTDMVCVPGSVRCAEGTDTATESCADDGGGWLNPVECPGGTTCDSGECLSACAENAKVDSFLGCDYWAVDLDQATVPCSAICDYGETCVDGNCEPSAATQEFSVAISNPNESEVEVTIENGETGEITTHMVAAETVQSIPLGRLDLDGTSLSRRAFHVTTDMPVTAHQFNPTNNVDVFSNDASLLLPTNAVGQHYYVLGWPTGVWISFGEYHARQYVTIIATEPEEITTVTLEPEVDIEVGVGVNAMRAADGEQVVLLNHGDVLHLQTYGNDGDDLTGTLIGANYPVAVFSGHECAFIPSTPDWVTLYCDHVEQQLFPIEVWGDTYYGVKLSPRGTEDDVWRVIAAEEGTVIETNPSIPLVDGETIGAGDFIPFTTDQSFEISGSGPILLGQFMVGSNYGIQATAYGESGTSTIPATCLGTGIGDPAFMLAVPVNQWRDNYIFLSPADYEQDWFTVVAPLTISDLILDGTPISTASMTQIGDTTMGYIYHNVSTPTSAQPHTITGSEPFGLYVYGYDCDVSYAYPGGLNLESEDEVE